MSDETLGTDDSLQKSGKDPNDLKTEDDSDTGGATLAGALLTLTIDELINEVIRSSGIESTNSFELQEQVIKAAYRLACMSDKFAANEELRKLVANELALRLTMIRKMSEELSQSEEALSKENPVSLSEPSIRLLVLDESSDLSQEPQALQDEPPIGS